MDKRQTSNSKGERLVQMDFGGDRKLTYTPEQLAHVDLAYATTIHKAMGSEFETVIKMCIRDRHTGGQE